MFPKITFHVGSGGITIGQIPNNVVIVNGEVIETPDFNNPDTLGKLVITVFTVGFIFGLLASRGNDED